MCRRFRFASGLSPSTRRGRIRGHLDLAPFGPPQPPLDPRRLRRDWLVFEPPRRAVPRDHDPQLVAELPRLTQEIEVTGMEEIEDPRRHYTDHKRHARTMSWPSRNTRFLSRAYAFASSLERARPSSDIISQIVAVGASPAMIMRAVVSS